MVSQVKIGPYILKVEEITDLKCPQKCEDLWGYYKADEGIINIRKNMVLERKQVAIVHELLHAMFDVCAIDNPEEEKIVSVLAPVLIQFIQDNPKLIKELQR